MFTLLFLLLPLAGLMFAIFWSRSLCRSRPTWRRRWIVLLTSLPVPALIWGLCALLAGDALTSTPEECGVDACGMAIMSAWYLAGMGLVAFVAIAAIAAFATRGVRAADDSPDIAEVFR